MLGVLAFTCAVLAACVPPVDGPPSTTSTTTVPPDPHHVSGAQLSWAYNEYAQYGVFGPWCQSATGHNVEVNAVDGASVTGRPSEAGKVYLQGQFDGGSGSIDPDSGEGTITWDSGDWVLNAYCGNFGAPDETLRDPVLQIGPDGSGTLSFEAYIPAGLDINGDGAPAAGPLRVVLATFDSLDELSSTSVRATPDFAGRTFTSDDGSPWEPCEVDGTVTGGAWPAEWISFLPGSVQAHYYTTGCAGLNLRKAPLPFEVRWGQEPSAITLQPTLSSTTVPASTRLVTLGARVGLSGVPTPTVTWQRSMDGTNWSDIDGATGAAFTTPLMPSDDGARFRASVANNADDPQVSDVIGPVTVTTSPVVINLGTPPTLVVGRGESAQINATIQGAPTPDLQWERSDDGGSTWSPVDESLRVAQVGAVQSTIVLGGTTDADDGAQFRVRADNGINGEQISPTVTLDVQFGAPTITAQPLPRAAFEGQQAVFQATARGLPAPTSLQWEVSTDAGSTWSDWSSAASPGTAATLNLAASDVTTALDGSLFRLRATSAAGSVLSDPVVLRVFAQDGSRQVIVVPDEPIDPSQPVTFEVIGSGFAPGPEIVSAMRLLITDTTRWQPGQTGNLSGAVTNHTVSLAALNESGGTFHRRYTLPADTFGTLDYGVATFGSHSSERFYDSWTPLVISAV